MKRMKTLLILALASFGISLLACSPLAAESYEADHVPWSGYWWPSIHGGLVTGSDYRGHPAPLEKYDQLVQGVFPGRSTQWYTDQYYDTSALSWFGLCWNWAQAATYENIDFYPSSENNILFRVGDKKGILTAANTDNLVVSENGSSPSVFHYWLLNYIQDQGKAFVADLDPSGELWSYPVYRFDMTSSARVGSEAVSVTIYYADDMVAPDYMGTQTRKKTYTYSLSLTGEGHISGGSWTGESVDDHPQGLTYVVTPASETPNLDYGRAVEIARSADDFLEEDGVDAVPISPGTYNLVLMDEDAYRIDCRAGDRVSLEILRLAGSSEDMLVSLTDAEGTELGATRIGGSKFSDAPAYRLTTASGTPPYTLTLGQDAYRDPNVYTLVVDVDRSFQQTAPYIPSFMWSGFAVTNPTDSPVQRVSLTSYDQEGAPIHTALGPLTMNPGEKRVVLLDQLPWRLHEFAMIDRVVLKADGFVNFLNLFGDTGGKYMSSFSRPMPRDDRLVAPGALTDASDGRKIFTQILNPSEEEIPVTLRLYAQDGTFVRQVETAIGAGEKLNLQPGRAPFYYSMSDTHWVEVANSGGNLMAGFQTESDAASAEAVALATVDGGTKIIPHVPPQAGNWNLMVTLINPNDAENRIRLHPVAAGTDAYNDLVVVLGPREKRMVDVQSHFARPAGDPLYHSLIAVSGELPFVGWYAYGAPGGGDRAALPFIDEADHDATLVMPHNAGAGGGAWWTGVCVGNPSDQPVSVLVEPHDAAGAVMSDRVKTLDLAPGAYEILTVGAWFGPLNADISFFKFRVASPAQERICGFYLYGKLENGVFTTQQLAGGNMAGVQEISEDLPSGTELVRGPGIDAWIGRPFMPAPGMETAAF